MLWVRLSPGRRTLEIDLTQPVVIDDYDAAIFDAVRNLFVDPDAPVPDASHGGADGYVPDLRVTSIGGASPKGVATRGGALLRTLAERATNKPLSSQLHMLIYSVLFLYCYYENMSQVHAAGGLANSRLRVVTSGCTRISFNRSVCSCEGAMLFMLFLCSSSIQDSETC